MSETQIRRVEHRRGLPATREARARAGEDSRSPVLWLVLALLIERPSHGYELSQRYDERFGSFAALSVPRIYAALDRLRDGGMIEPIALQEGKSVPKQHLMRRSYRASAAGVAAYRNWVAERMQDDPQRPQLLARIASAGWLGLEGILSVIDRYERACVEELRRLAPDDGRLAGGECSLQELTSHLVEDQQRRELRARHDWAVHARAAVLAHMQNAANGQAEAPGELP